MANTQQIDINQAADRAEFTPVKVAAGSLVFWSNNTSAKHWPAPEGGPDDGWLNSEIPGKLPGQDSPVSPQVGLGVAGTVKYYCAIHPNETGTIVVV